MNNNFFNRVNISKIANSKILLYCAVLALVLKISLIGILINIPQNIFFADITESALIYLTNQSREESGLNSLVENEKLNQAAALKAKNMIDNQYFSHTSPTGITPWYWFSETGYEYEYAGENLAIGFYDSKEVFDAWSASPSHRDNLLNPKYTEIGTSVMSGFGGNDAVVVVQMFASQKKKLTQTKEINNTIGNIDQEKKEKQESQALESNNTSDKSQDSSQMILGAQKSEGKNDFYSRFLNQVIYNQEGLVQEIIYGISFVIIGIMLTAIFFGRPVENKGLVFRSLLIFIILSAAILIDREIVVAFIPRQVRI